MQENRMGKQSVRKLVWSMGLPMILSMILQALYNVVDTTFVINMGGDGAIGNLALSAAFPVQILMIAIGVGTGIGINALLSKNLGMGNKEEANKIAGNGILLAVVFYVIFLLFGLFGTKGYFRLMSDTAEVRKMGVSYLTICCTLSFGCIGFAIYERFLMATGKTLFSMIAQVTGAVANIVLDYLFIFVCRMGIAGAAYATVIGQIASLVLAMFFHYRLNKEIDGKVRYIRLEGKKVKGIYKIGFPAFLMQAMLAFMMFGVLLIIKTIDDSYTVNLLSGSFGIYYKLMQIALFAAFGLSNALISIVSFNYGMKDKERVDKVIKEGAFAGIVVTLFVTLLYQIFSRQVSSLFALTIDETSIVTKADIINTCNTALHIATIGYIFMGFSVVVQGVLQGFDDVYKPLVISFLRLIALVLPLFYIGTLTPSPEVAVWWTFPIAEAITAAVSFFLLKKCKKGLRYE